MIPGFEGKIPPLRNKERLSAVSQEVNSIFKIKMKPENVRTQCTQKQKAHLGEGSSTFPGEDAMHSGKCRKELSAMQTCAENSRTVKESLVPGEPHRPQFSRKTPYRTHVNWTARPDDPSEKNSNHLLIHTNKLHRQRKVSNLLLLHYLFMGLDDDNYKDVCFRFGPKVATLVQRCHVY